MTRVSSFTAFQAGVSGILDGQSKMDRAQAQASSQKNAWDLKGYGHNAKKLVDTRAMINRLEARNEDLKSLDARATVEETALTSFTTAIGNARQAINNALAQQNGAGLDAALEAALNTAMTASNTTFAGQSIFGGVNSYDTPVIYANLNTLAGQPDTNSNFKDMGENRVVTLDEGRTIEISKSAKEVFQPFMEFMRGLKVYENANGTFEGKLTPAQQTWLKSQLPALETVQNNAIGVASSQGVTAKEISDTLARNDEKITRLNEIVGDVVNVDLTEVAARLSAAQTQYQASASIFGQLKGMNLLQYLR